MLPIHLSKTSKANMDTSRSRSKSSLGLVDYADSCSDASEDEDNRLSQCMDDNDVCQTQQTTAVFRDDNKEEQMDAVQTMDVLNSENSMVSNGDRTEGALTLGNASNRCQGYHHRTLESTSSSCVANRPMFSKKVLSEHSESTPESELNLVPRSTPKFTLKTEEQTIAPKQRKLNETESEAAQSLSVPDSIQSMFQTAHQGWIDNASEHNMRVRTFAHVEGNWATHVFIPVGWSDKLFEFVSELVSFLEPVTFHTMPEFHVSLSRTVCVRHHWIEPLVESLRLNLKPLKSSVCDLLGVKLYTNDEHTRTFLCLELSEEDTHFLEYVKAVDTSFAEFKLPAYYEEPLFHISVAWGLGDVIKDIPQSKMAQCQELLAHFMASNPELSILLAQQICCRSGNKIFAFALGD